MANKSNLIPQQHKLTVEEQSKRWKKISKIQKREKVYKKFIWAITFFRTKGWYFKRKNKSFRNTRRWNHNTDGIMCFYYKQSLARKFKSIWNYTKFDRTKLEGRNADWTCRQYYFYKWYYNEIKRKRGTRRKKEKY